MTMLRKLRLALLASSLACGPAAAQHVGPISPAATNTITTGGTWQLLFGSNTNRTNISIENYCTATSQGVTLESIFIYFLPPNTAAPTTASGPTLGAFELQSCANLTFTGPYISTQAVYVLATTTAHAFAAWQNQ